MRKYVMTSIVLLPLLLTFSHAAQNWSVDPPAQPWVFSSEDSGTSSYLGVDISDVTTERLSALKLKEEKGVEVTMVDQDAPAGKAGIKEHDVILTMNGTSIESGAQLRRMIHEMPPGRVVTFGLSRDGQPDDGEGATGRQAQRVFGPQSQAEAISISRFLRFTCRTSTFRRSQVMVTSSARSGLMVENIYAAVGRVLRGEERQWRAGAVGGKRQPRREGWVPRRRRDRQSERSGGARHQRLFARHEVAQRQSVNVGVVRDKKEQNLTLSLPDRKESGDLLEEESSDDLWIDADSRVELGELQNEIAKLRPQMELAAKDYRKSAGELRKSLCDQQKKFREESSKQRTEIRKQERDLRLKLDQMRRNAMFRTWADI